MNNVIGKLTVMPLRDKVKIIILFAFSGYFLWSILTGSLANYINTRFAWLSWVAVVLFLALAIADVVVYLRKADDTENPLIAQPSTMPKGWGVIVVCAIPLVLGTLIPSQPLGIEAVTGTLSTSVSVSSGTIITRDPAKRNILDWLRAFAIEADKTKFNDVQAEIIGFVYHDPEFPTGQFMVGRFVVSCCTADASPIGLPVYAIEADSLPEGQWVSIKGAFTAGEFRGAFTPILHAESVEQIDPPQNSYLYP